MSMAQDIRGRILDEVSDYLDEFDIDAMIKKMVSSDKINETIHQKIKDTITEIVLSRVQEAMQKRVPVIDAWANDRVNEFIKQTFNEANTGEVPRV